MQNKPAQIVAVILLVVFLGLLSDPFMVLMPPPVAMAVLVLAAALSAAFAGLVVAERPGDEREDAHRAAAGRAAYLAGIVVLALGLLIEGFSAHHVDPWLLGALAAMIVAKVLARLRLDDRE